MFKVLIVIPTLDRSGAEKQFAHLAVGLKEQGHAVEVIALNRSGPYGKILERAQIPVIVMHKRGRFDASLILRLRKEICERTPDVILSCLFSANAAVRLATFGLGRKRPKVVISERCVDSWKSAWQLWLDRLLRSSTDLMVANSQSVKEFYAGQGFPVERIEVIPNGVEVPPQPTLSREDLCKLCDIPQHARLLMFIGRLAPQKRIKDLLWAIQMVRHSCPDAYLLIIGNGPEREELQIVAKEVEADSHSRFLGARSDASSLLHYADAFWLASEFEGMSNSLMEAMACGVPVVVSDIPPNRELVQHGETGWLVDLGDLAGFAQYTVRLLRDPPLASKLGTAAAARMASDYTFSGMVAYFEKVIEQALSQR